MFDKLNSLLILRTAFHATDTQYKFAVHVTFSVSFC